MSQSGPASGGAGGGGNLTKFPITPYVVGPIGNAGYQTIQSAINAANAAGGGMVWVQPGTYTENLTFFSGIQISGPSEQSVTIIGTHSPPSSGTLNIDRLAFQSATNIFSSNAAGTCAIIMEDCQVNVTNGYTFNLPNWTSAGEVAVFNIGNFGTNDGFINNTGGTGFFLFSAGAGNGTVNPMILSGTTILAGGVVIGCPVSLQTGANLTSVGSQYNGTITCSNNSIASFYGDSMVTGANTALVNNSTGTITLNDVTVNTSANPSISGTGSGITKLCAVNFVNNASVSGTFTISTATANVFGEVRAGTDAGGQTNFTSITNVNSQTIGAGTGTVKMSSANSANNSMWLKVYVGTTQFWIPAWSTNSP